MFAPGSALLEGISPASRPRWSGDWAACFPPIKDVFHLMRNPDFGLTPSPSCPAQGQGTRLEKQPIFLTLRLGAFLFSTDVRSALTSVDLCSQFIWGKNNPLILNAECLSLAGAGRRRVAEVTQEFDAACSLGIDLVCSVLWVTTCSLQEKIPCGHSRSRSGPFSCRQQRISTDTFVP